MYTIYSDISIRRLCGYGIVILHHLTPIHTLSGVILSNNSARAEIGASVLALNKIPDGAEVTMYTDLDALPIQLGYSEYNFTEIEALRLELRRLKVRIVRVNKGAHFYRKCHEMARYAAQ